VAAPQTPQKRTVPLPCVFREPIDRQATFVIQVRSPQTATNWAKEEFAREMFGCEGEGGGDRSSRRTKAPKGKNEPILAEKF